MQNELRIDERPGNWITFDESENDKDITRQAWQRTGDMQGIPWQRVNLSRELYRAERMQHVRNYFNVLELGDEAKLNHYKQRLKLMEGEMDKDGMFYQFAKTWRDMRPQVLHFQLRNLVWATSPLDVYFTQDHCVKHFNTAFKKVTTIMNLQGGQQDVVIGNRPLHKVQISTLCVKHGVVAAGGFNAELVVQRFNHRGYAFVGKITEDDNGITNGLDVFDNGARLV
eukprot:TRINITY_DN4364_c1_g1_i5.p2 TRINITY_DN4364_c1_g1~~TRINITY_DN4364_c1_g1_i5.p2  ORF type:complete len:226 (+),score=27.16 TRINITY_DN4364_c1_g1_i5:191-868(+)